MSDTQPEPAAVARYRFGTFEADAATGELRRQGIRVKLNAQPFQVLLMLLEQPGDLLTRDEIARRLWSDGTFVDYEHGVNSAVNRIREALGDAAGNPRFIETLARRGYRFIAPVQRVAANGTAPAVPAEAALPAKAEPEEALAAPVFPGRILASAEELPKASYQVVVTLFILFQLMCLGFYIGALANLSEIGELLEPLPRAAFVVTVIIVSGAILIPVRAFLVCAVLFRAPGFRARFLRLWIVLLLADVLWALSPFLLLHHINFGVAVACMALLVYSPFVQRSLVLMGAGWPRTEIPFIRS